jgi:hypothetical protein
MVAMSIDLRTLTLSPEARVLLDNAAELASHSTFGPGIARARAAAPGTVACLLWHLTFERDRIRLAANPTWNEHCAAIRLDECIDALTRAAIVSAGTFDRAIAEPAQTPMCADLDKLAISEAARRLLALGISVLIEEGAATVHETCPTVTRGRMGVLQNWVANQRGGQFGPTSHVPAEQAAWELRVVLRHVASGDPRQKFRYTGPLARVR